MIPHMVIDGFPCLILLSEGQVAVATHYLRPDLVLFWSRPQALPLPVQQQEQMLLEAEQGCRLENEDTR